MKILTLAPEPFFQNRGTPMSVYYRVLTMSQMGHSVDILAYHIGEDIDLPGVRLFRTPNIPFFRKIKIGPSYGKLFIDFFFFFKALWLILRNHYDLIHANEEAVYFSIIYKKLFGIRVLYDMHSNLSQQLGNFNFTRNALVIKIFKALDRWAVREADAVLTICPDLNKAVEEIAPGKRYFLVENSLFSAVRLAADKQHHEVPGLPDISGFGNKQIILYAGTFEHYQGIPLLLESARYVIEKFPDALFVLAGGTAQQVDTMKKKARESGIEKEVVFTGNLPQNQMSRLIDAADILVSPRLKGTNTPLKIYSYLDSGKPIVATDLYTHQQVLTPEVAMLTPADPAGFAKGIITLLADKGLRDTVASRARSYYEHRYGQKQYKEKLSEALRCAVSAAS